MKVNLTGVSETLLIPLWARANETTYSNSIIKDSKAVEIINKMDYDFSKFKNSWLTQTGVAVRTKIFDDQVRKFVKKYSNAVVINIGCGLDTRFERVDNGRITWYDLDLPQAIEVRKKFFKENDRYKMISQSVFDNSWTQCIEQANKKVLVIAEGILMYFSKEEVVHILDILQKAFDECECLFEVTSPFIANNSRKHETVKKTNAVFKWGIKDGTEIETYNIFVKLIEEWNFFDFNKDRWRFMRLLSKIAFIKNNCNNRIIHLRIT
ncbi:MAG: class I SAM-dependent methyltransferase [Clostridium butyricum]|nr:class I SAM-dependent methyltransferase [Clostridium butyricum]